MSPTVTPLFVVTVLCPGCQKARSPREMIQHPGYQQCLHCEARHIDALNALATGKPPSECSECNTSWEDLRAQGHDRMACHMENGHYRMMCMRCDAFYVTKRKELYGPTQFGYQNGLS